MPADGPPDAETLASLLERNDPSAVDALERLESAPPKRRKSVLRSLRGRVDDPSALEPVCGALVTFLTDAERPVRLSTAKLLVTLAEGRPGAVEPAVDALAARLADETEFYYVRARAAEALGYVALEHPDSVSTPEILADLRVGLSFEDAEVREKLAKALEHIALGDPPRLRHHVGSLADHLDDEETQVRYHLASVMVVIGTEAPERLAAARDALAARLDDENVYVRGRAAEALGMLARAESDVALPRLALEEMTDDEAFAAERAHFALGASGDGPVSDSIGTLPGVRETTADAVEAITAPETEGECAHCGLNLPAEGPPMCPRCGAPY